MRQLLPRPRYLTGILILSLSLGFLTTSAAQVTLEQVENKSGSDVQVYNLTLSGARPPSPALKHRLTVPIHKTIPGNSITHYLRSYGENSLNSPLKEARRVHGDRFFDWLSIEQFPLNKLPLEKLEQAAKLFDSYVDNHIARATLCRDIDWGLAEETLSGVDSINFLLPSIQQTRSISRVLSLRTRLAIAQGDFEKAVAHMRMNYRLAESVSKMKFLVCSLVGIAEIGIANGNALDFIAAENSPNLYWALTELPHPQISIRDAIRLEMSIGVRLIPAFDSPETAVHSPEEWTRVVKKATEDITKVMNAVGNVSDSASAFSDAAAFGLSLAGYSAAKKRLVDGGMDETKVGAMSVGQVIMIDAARDYRIFADRMEAAFNLRSTTTQEMFNEWEEELVNATKELRFGAILANTCLPAVQQVRNANLRIQRESAVLITLESIRNHLAEKGALPKSLAELSLPSPPNPFTGKPLQYELKDGKGIINCPNSDGHPIPYRYIISVR